MFPQARASLAASAGIFLGPDYHFDMVRPGISLYGGGPEERPDARLSAVATFKAPLLAIRHVPAGSNIGYGPSMVVDRPSRVGLVAAGYADGLIRAAKGKSQAWVDGGLCRVLIVTMDLIVVDLEDAEVQVGDWVEFMGPNVALDDLAAAAGTVAHECLVRLNRAERIYIGEA
jgi:alanine racemase